MKDATPAPRFGVGVCFSLHSAKSRHGARCRVRSPGMIRQGDETSDAQWAAPTWAIISSRPPRHVIRRGFPLSSQIE